MDRRDFVKTGLVAGALGPSTLVDRAAEEERHFYELRFYETRSDMSPNRIRNFFRDAMVPALQRAGTGPVGLFTPDIGLPGQTVVVLIDYRSAADALAIPQRLAADEAYTGALHGLEADAQVPYVRYESHLMRAFANHPRVEVPPGDASRPARMFELRTYESRDSATLARKIAMFNEAEIDLFRSIGMTPVFFGENLFAPRLPSLTYMLTFEDVAARTKAWKTFGSHPEWKRISKDPRWDTEGITTATSAVFLNPAPGSQIR